MKHKTKESVMIARMRKAQLATRRAERYAQKTNGAANNSADVTSSLATTFSFKQYDAFANTRQRRRDDGAQQQTTSNTVVCEPNAEEKAHWNQFHTRKYRDVTGGAMTSSERSSIHGGSDAGSEGSYSSGGGGANGTYHRDSGAAKRGNKLVPKMGSDVACRKHEDGTSGSEIADVVVKTGSMAVIKYSSPRSSMESLSTGVDSHSTGGESDVNNRSANGFLDGATYKSNEGISISDYIDTDLSHRFMSLNTKEMLNNLSTTKYDNSQFAVDKSAFCGVPLLFPQSRLQTVFPYYSTLNPLAQQLCPGHLVMNGPNSYPRLSRNGSTLNPRISSSSGGTVPNGTSSLDYKRSVSDCTGSRGAKINVDMRANGKQGEEAPLRLKYTTVPNAVQYEHQQNIIKLAQISSQNRAKSAQVYSENTLSATDPILYSGSQRNIVSKSASVALKRYNSSHSDRQVIHIHDKSASYTPQLTNRTESQPHDVNVPMLSNPDQTKPQSDRKVSSTLRTPPTVFVKHSERGYDISMRSREMTPRDGVSRQFKTRMCDYRQSHKLKRAGNGPVIGKHHHHPTVVGMNPLKKKGVNYSDGKNHTGPPELPPVLSLQISLPRVSVEDADDISLREDPSVSSLRSLDLDSNNRILNGPVTEEQQGSSKNGYQTQTRGFAHDTHLMATSRFAHGDTLLTKSLPMIIVSDDSGDETQEHSSSTNNDDGGDLIQIKRLRVIRKGSAARPGSAPVQARNNMTSQGTRALSAGRIINIADDISNLPNGNTANQETNKEEYHDDSKNSIDKNIKEQNTNTGKKTASKKNTDVKCSQCSTKDCDGRFCRYVSMSRPPHMRRKSDSAAVNVRSSDSSLNLLPVLKPGVKTSTVSSKRTKRSNSLIVHNLQKTGGANKADSLSMIGRKGKYPPKSAPHPRRRNKVKLRPISRENNDNFVRPGSVEIVSYMATRGESPLPPETDVTCSKPEIDVGDLDECEEIEMSRMHQNMIDLNNEGNVAQIQSAAGIVDKNIIPNDTNFATDQNIDNLGYPENETSTDHFSKNISNTQVDGPMKTDKDQPIEDDVFSDETTPAICVDGCTGTVGNKAANNELRAQTLSICDGSNASSSRNSLSIPEWEFGGVGDTDNV